MKSNIIIKMVAIGGILMVALIVMKMGKKSDSNNNLTLTSIENGPKTKDNGLTQNKYQKQQLRKEFNVDTDSPVETMRTLTSEMLDMRKTSTDLQKENKVLKQKIGQLLKMEKAISSRVNKNLDVAERKVDAKQKKLERDQNKSESLLAKLQNKLESYTKEGKGKPGNRSAKGYEIGGSDIPSGLGYDENGISQDFDQIIWTNPLDLSVDDSDPTKISLPNLFDTASDALPGINNERKDKKDRLIEAYTIPQNATLLGSVSMTALLGRIPTGGQIQDPYPFKIMVGEDNLSSNGIKIPNVTGIKMTGVASGDWTLSCVSGKIYSMTFTFRDGTIRTIPEPTDGESDESNPIAWLSDEYGIPCISGMRITNAVSYLSSRVGLSTASGYASATAAAELTNQVNSQGGSSTTLTGDPNTYARNLAISDGISEVTDWLDARQSSSFDAIYVSPGTKLAIHITKELKIDYDPEGRKVNHYANTNRRSKYHID